MPHYSQDGNIGRRRLPGNDLEASLQLYLRLGLLSDEQVLDRL